MAKLQETLEIFMEELGKVLASINSIKEINPIIDSKIKEIKGLALKVEISNLESINQAFLRNLEKYYLMIDETAKQHIESLKNLKQKEKNYFNRYYKIGIGLLVAFLLSMTLAMKFYYNQNLLRKIINMNNLKIEFYRILLMKKNSMILLKNG